MTYIAKTSWKYDEIVTESDMNRIENGVKTAHDQVQQALATGETTKLDLQEHKSNADPHPQYQKKADPPTSHTHAAATTTADGFMSAADKTKLDGVQGGAISKATADGLYAAKSHVGSGEGAHPVATTASAGFMSKDDKTKLDTIEPYSKSVTSSLQWGLTLQDGWSTANTSNNDLPTAGVVAEIDSEYMAGIVTLMGEATRSVTPNQGSKLFTLMKMHRPVDLFTRIPVTLTSLSNPQAYYLGMLIIDGGTGVVSLDLNTLAYPPSGGVRVFLNGVCFRGKPPGA